MVDEVLVVTVHGSWVNAERNVIGEPPEWLAFFSAQSSIQESSHRVVEVFCSEFEWVDESSIRIEDHL
jgi:hypothetical protein